MKLTKQEKNLLAIERFMIEFKDHFEGITFISLSSSNSSGYSRLHSPTDKIFPFNIRVEQTKDLKTFNWSNFSWEKGASDDELPLYDKYGEHYGYHDVKKHVEKFLPEAFKGRTFYDDAINTNSDNISALVAPIKAKVAAIEIEKQLTNKNQPAKKKLKI